MLEIEIDGKTVAVEDGSTVMDAANKVGTYIPHFCYHKKLSIAANCRMCLVQVEKAPKPLPACATPVTAGMKVITHSDMAVKAQKGVMEFLLINHPLDCPICDQGGECQLQDLAVGYGASNARYQEEKRVVLNKNLGPLISTDMTRCIHCTRCVRFGQEIAGVMELGVANRGEHSEIMAFVNRTVDSELSGNMIDLCPVGALTSKPFRFSARTWELSRRKSVSPHDSLGANLIVQVKHDRVMRVLPLENEAVNECWLSDRDRFSYEALNSDERLTRPMIKHDGKWREVDWEIALEYVANTFKGVIFEHGADAIGALLSPHSTVEELYLAQKIMRALGSENIDTRLRQNDFSLDLHRSGAPWLGMPIAELNDQDAILVIGSFLRKDHPLIAARLRRIAKSQLDVMRIHATQEDWLMPIQAESIVTPSQMPKAVAQVLLELANAKGMSIAPHCQQIINTMQVNTGDKNAQAIAQGLAREKTAILLGNYAKNHPQAAVLHILAQELARIAGAKLGVLGEAANSLGAYLTKATPVGAAAGLNAHEMLQQPRRAYMLFGVEPDLDCANPMLARDALASADSVMYMGAFKSSEVAKYADVMLPIAPFAETSGTYVNCEGRAQKFNAVVKPQGDARPGWKVLRVIGNMLGLAGFEYETSEAVRADALPADISTRLNNHVEAFEVDANTKQATSGSFERVSDVPIYFADALVRRAPSLQKTRDAQLPVAYFNPSDLQTLGLAAGEPVRVQSQFGEVIINSALDPTLTPACVKIAAAHLSTATLGGMFGEVTIERA